MVFPLTSDFSSSSDFVKRRLVSHTHTPAFLAEPIYRGVPSLPFFSPSICFSGLIAFFDYILRKTVNLLLPDA